MKAMASALATMLPCYASNKDIQAVVESYVQKKDAATSTNNYEFLLDDMWQGIRTIATETNLWNTLHLCGRIFIILVISYFFMRLIDKIIHTCGPRISASRAVNGHSSVINTVLPIMRSVLRWILGMVTLLLLLSEFGVNTTPLICSLSVVGLAVSIGSQDIVKDFINGIMSVVEGTMAVGDEVIIGKYKGVVESMSLRHVHIRHEMGALHTIPFSEVGTVSNISRDFAKITFTLICAPSVSLTLLQEIFEDVFKALQSQHHWHRAMKHPLDFQGIKSVTAQGVEIHAQLQTTHEYASSLRYAFYNQLLPLCNERGVPLVFNECAPSSDKSE